MVDGMIVAIAILIVLAIVFHARVKSLEAEIECLREWIAEVQCFVEEGFENE